MRRMLNTLFILSEETYLALENENVVVKNDDKVLGRVPLLNLENILYFGYHIAKNFIVGKIFNSRAVIERMKRAHPLNIDKDKFQAISNDLKVLAKKAREVHDKEILLGIEGNAASLYFSALDDLILRNKQDFEFKSRQRHPPIGRVNALLSFAYNIGARLCLCAGISRT